MDRGEASDTPGEREVARRGQEGRRKSARHCRPRPGFSWRLTAGAILSLAVSVLLAWRLLTPAAPPADIDTDALNATLRAALVGQSAVIGSLVRHVQQAQVAGRRRVDLLAVGPTGTGKTLLGLVLARLPGVTGRRLIGGQEVGHERAALLRLADELRAAAAAAPAAWLLLAFDDVAAHLAEVVLLTEEVARAAPRLITLVTATTSDAGGQRGADAQRLAFGHALRLAFRPMRRAQVAACVRRYAEQRGATVDAAAVNQVVAAVKFDGQYAVSGCKDAIYQLQATYRLTAEQPEPSDAS